MAIFDKWMSRLRDEVPDLFIRGEQQWSQQVRAYWRKLKRFDMALVELAIDRSSDEYPGKFPTVGQLVRLCKVIDAEHKKAAREQGEQESRAFADRVEQERVEYLRNEIVPDDPAQQRAYIDAGDSPFERLAREFEVDSKRRALDPLRASPDDVTRHRMQRIRDTWAELDSDVPPPFVHNQQRPVTTPSPMREPGED